MMFKKNQVSSIRKHIFMLTLSVLMLFLLFNMLVAVYFVVLPVINRSVNDFSNLLIENKKTWDAASPIERETIKDHLLNTQDIMIDSRDLTENSVAGTSFLPYIYFLEKHLNQKSNDTIHLGLYPQTHYPYQVRIGSIKPTYFYFSRQRIGTSPPFVFISFLVSAIFFSILGSYLLAHRLNQYFAPLINASLKLSKGEVPEPIPEQGPLEVQLLSKTFNKMSHDVRELLDNRTILLVGVSHNLRTPVTRIKLGLELLPKSVPVELKDTLNRSLDDIDNTIAQFLKMAESLSTFDIQQCQLNPVLHNIISGFNHHDIQIVFNPLFDRTHKLSTTALEQIMLNLIENCIRYAGDTPIHIVTEHDKDTLVIQVIDQGPGIPEEIKDIIFRPFVSLQLTEPHLPGGTGLGLAICQIMAKAHNWTLSLQANIPQGTRAVLTIPLNDTKSESLLSR